MITVPQSLDRNWGTMLVCLSLWGQTQAAAVIQKFLLVALPLLRSVPGLVYFVALHTEFPWVGTPSLSLCFPAEALPSVWPKAAAPAILRQCLS